MCLRDSPSAPAEWSEHGKNTPSSFGGLRRPPSRLWDGLEGPASLCRLKPLTFPRKSGIIPPVYSEEEEEYPPRCCIESPRFGARGRANGGEYTLELAPQRPFSPVGVLRKRPLPRRRVLARHEAVLREEAANQRWYRESSFALCPTGTEGVFTGVRPANAKREKGETHYADLRGTEGPRAHRPGHR